MSSLRNVVERILFTVLIPLSISSTIALYIYPILQGCSFPLPTTTTTTTARESHGGGKDASFLSAVAKRSGVINTIHQHATTDWNLGGAANNGFLRAFDLPEPAIFRLLVLADPQIEGDSSLPSPEDNFLPRLRRHVAKIHSAWSSSSGSSSSSGEEAGDSERNNIATILVETSTTIFLEDIPSAFRATRKRLDLLGNDYYLAHIYRTLAWWSRPTHVTVLGDLIGSQWVTDEEFENRGWRFWQRVFRGGQRVDDDITLTGDMARQDREESLGEEKKKKMEILQRYRSPWANRIINVAGNHDIGYAGDVSKSRLERFERVFGRANWDIRFEHPALQDDNNNTEEKMHAEGDIDGEETTKAIQPTLHIINLNDLTLDGPAMDPSIQADSYAYINDLLTHRSRPVEDETSFTLLLTHVPLHKREGICVDAPYFSFFDEEDLAEDGETINAPPRWVKDGVREQNHLSEHVSTNGILEGILGMSGHTFMPAGGRGRRGLILTGHDHEGCDVVHFVNRTGAAVLQDNENDDNNNNNNNDLNEGAWHWDAVKYSPHTGLNGVTDEDPSIREVTLRSMMGEYGGNAALLSLWFDSNPEVNQWRYEIQVCPAGVQHLWWAVHGLAVVCIIALVVRWISQLWMMASGLFGRSKDRVLSDVKKAH